MINHPVWAQDLLLNALSWAEEKGYKAEIPNLVWRRCNKFGSGGHARQVYPVCITMNAGKDHTEQKIVLLHELAHILNPNEGHTAKFWDTAWELFRWAKLPIRVCKIREGNYKKGALLAYDRSKRSSA